MSPVMQALTWRHVTLKPIKPVMKRLLHMFVLTARAYISKGSAEVKALAKSQRSMLPRFDAMQANYVSHHTGQSGFMLCRLIWRMGDMSFRKAMLSPLRPCSIRCVAEPDVPQPEFDGMCGSTNITL